MNNGRTSLEQNDIERAIGGSAGTSPQMPR